MQDQKAAPWVVLVSVENTTSKFGSEREREGEAGVGGLAEWALPRACNTGR